MVRTIPSRQHLHSLQQGRCSWRQEALTHHDSLLLERFRVWLEHSCHQVPAQAFPLSSGLAYPPPSVSLSLQVTLDLSQRRGIVVRRVLNTQHDVVNEFGVTSFPSCYLLFRNGSSLRIPV